MLLESPIKPLSLIIHYLYLFFSLWVCTGLITALFTYLMWCHCDRYALTGHFASTGVVPRLPSELSVYDGFSRVLETFLRDSDMITPNNHGRFANCTSMMMMMISSHSTISQRCSSELRSDDLETIWVQRTHRQPSEDGSPVVIKGWAQLWCLKDAELVLRSPKYATKISPPPLHHRQQPEPLREGRTEPNSDHTIWRWPEKLRLLNLLSSSFSEPSLNFLLFFLRTV